MVYKPGQSGNPGGRTIVMREREKHMREVWLGLAGENFELYIQRGHDIIMKGEDKDSIAMMKLAYDRVFGAVKQSLDLQVDDAPKREINWSTVPIERRREMLATLAEIGALSAPVDES